MSRQNQDSMHEALCQYLLGTLEEDARREVEGRINTDENWAAALEEERQALDVLDALSDEPVPQGLSHKVLERLDDEVQAPSRSSLFRLAIATVLFVVAVPSVFLFVENRSSTARDQLATNNLMQIGMALEMYSNESRGEKYPPLAPYDDLWIFDVSVLYPNYLPDLTLLVSPNLPNYRELIKEMEDLQAEESIDWERVSRIAADTYTYLSWLVEEPEQIPDLANERFRLASAEYDKDIPQEDLPFFRLREGIERLLITDINNAGASSLGTDKHFVLFEASALRKFNKRLGIRVLYLDGHVEFEPEGSSLLSSGSITEALSGAAN